MREREENVPLVSVFMSSHKDKAPSCSSFISETQSNRTQPFYIKLQRTRLKKNSFSVEYSQQLIFKVD